jgi:hypothetical protein
VNQYLFQKVRQGLRRSSIRLYASERRLGIRLVAFPWWCWSIRLVESISTTKENSVDSPMTRQFKATSEFEAILIGGEFDYRLIKFSLGGELTTFKYSHLRCVIVVRAWGMDLCHCTESVSNTTHWHHELVFRAPMRSLRTIPPPPLCIVRYSIVFENLRPLR